MELYEIAEIRLGKSMQRVREGENSGVSSKLLRYNGENFCYDDLPDIKVEPNVKKGDVIMSLVNDFVSIDIKYDNIFVNNNVAIINSKDSNYLNKFLAIYLNSHDVQRFFNTVCFGRVSMNTLSVRDLEKVSIPNIALEKQRELIRLYECAERLKWLYVQKNALLDQLVKSSLKKSLGSV